jgi:L-lactate dehydrogenase (cytochrome)
LDAKIAPQGVVIASEFTLKALSVGAKACSGGRFYLYALAAAGQLGVERSLRNFYSEIERDLKLMGCRSLADLRRENLRFR